MIRKGLILSFLLLMTILCAKSSVTPSQTEATTQLVETEINNTPPLTKNNNAQTIYSEDKSYLIAMYDLPHIKEFYFNGYITPPTLDYSQSLTIKNYDQLRLLRNEVFARNGYLFNDGFLRGYFNQYEWYQPIFDVDTFQVRLNRDEREFVAKIQSLEKKYKESAFVEKDELQLFNSDLAVNKKQYNKLPPNLSIDLREQNFSLMAANRSMPFYVYDKNAYQYIPHYITTDLYLFILHKYFSRFLEKLDENYLYEQLLEILRTSSLELNSTTSVNHQESIEWAKMYSTLALYAIGDSVVSPPAAYSNIFTKEKENIDNQSSQPSFIPNNTVDYNELKPRGHYTKSEKLKKYFRGFKWISLNGINLDNDKQIKGLLTFAYSIQNNEKLLKQYKEYISTVQKLAGQEDNLSLADIVNFANGNSLESILADDNIARVREKLRASKKEKIKKIFFSPNPEEVTIRVHFLSSTYSLSGDIFSKLVFNCRKFPKGLDIPAVFGNKTAQNILINEYHENDSCPSYLPKLKEMQKQFTGFSDWNNNYGFKGVKTALSASEEQDNYPDFMKTDSYNRKELSTTLASWTHIKHDLILYQEKPYAAECGQGGGPQPPSHLSYVEPNIIFWESALELVDWLEHITYKQSTYNDELRRIKELGILLRDITNKELNGQEITKEEFRELHYIGGTIEYILLGLLETDHLPEREKSMALIADVYVYNGANLNVAVGHADDIYTVVPIKGEYYIARGAVFSYYEFKGEIYNDDEWKAEIKNKTTPERPEWIRPLIRDNETIVGKMQYRYSGYRNY